MTDEVGAMPCATLQRGHVRSGFSSRARVPRAAVGKWTPPLCAVSLLLLLAAFVATGRAALVAPALAGGDHHRRLAAGPGGELPALFVQPLGAVAGRVAGQSVLTGGAGFTLSFRVEASALIPAAHPAHTRSATGLRLMATPQSQYVDAQMAPAHSVMLVFAVPSGVMQLADATVSVAQVQAGTDAPSVAVSAAASSVELHSGVQRVTPMLRLDSLVVPALVNLTGTVDAVSLQVPSMSPGDAITVTFGDVTVPLGTPRGTRLQYAVAASVAAVNATSGATLDTFLGAQVQSLVVACDDDTSCSGAGSCSMTATGDGVCDCLMTWGGADCSVALATCAGDSDPVSFSVEEPEFDVPQQRFAHLGLSLMLVVLMLRVGCCCSTRWTADKSRRLDQSLQLERNWRNRVVVGSLVMESVACAAPAFTASTGWSFLVPVKFVARVVTMTAVRSSLAYAGVLAVGTVATLATLVAVLVTRRPRGSRVRVGPKSTVSIRVSDASLALPAIKAGSHNQPVVVSATGEVSMAGTAAPSTQLTRLTALGVYGLAMVFFQPLLNALMRVWTCGFPFRPYAGNGAAAEDCLLTQECWTLPHCVACVVSGAVVCALVAIATVTITHVQRVDSPTGSSWSTLPPQARLQVQLSGLYIISVVTAKLCMAWTSLVFKGHEVTIGGVEVPVQLAVACAVNVCLLALVLFSHPVSMDRANVLPRIAMAISTCTCFLVLGLRVLAPSTLVTEAGLDHDLDVEAAMRVPVLVAAGTWVVAAVAGTVAYFVHRRVSCAGRPLWLPAVSGGGGLSGSKSWTGSFRVVNDWNAMEDSWSGSVVGSAHDLNAVVVGGASAGHVDAKAGPRGQHRGGSGRSKKKKSSGRLAVATGGSGRIRRAPRFRNNVELKEKLATSPLALESLVLSDEENFGGGVNPAAFTSAAGARLADRRSARHTDSDAAMHLSRETGAGIQVTPEHRAVVNTPAAEASARRSRHKRGPSVRKTVSRSALNGQYANLVTDGPSTRYSSASTSTGASRRG